MITRTATVAALGFAVLILGCTRRHGAKIGAKQTGTKAIVKKTSASVPQSVGPLESLRADAKFDPSVRHFVLFDCGLIHGRFVQFVEGPFSASEIHRGHIEEFVRKPGVGNGRLAPEWPTPESAWIELLAVGPSEQSLSEIHGENSKAWYNPLTKTLTLRSGRRSVRRERVWLFQKRQLVSVNSAKGPAVYLNSPVTQHALMDPEWSSALVDKLRLDAFEKEALELLRKGDEVVLRSDDRKLRMFGAIRARKDCLSCHKGQVGTLLGAFTYTLELQSEETPDSHKMKDKTDLTDRQLRAVRSIEAVGGKLIRTPGGAVTEVQMTFSRTQEAAAKRGRQPTRLALRDSALPHLLAFPDLAVLDVSDSLVSDTGLKTIGELRNLKRLNLRDTGVTSDGVAELRKALPDCEILNTTDPPSP